MLQNDNADSVFPATATCGDVDGTGASTNTFNRCSDFSSELSTFGGVLMYDTGKSAVNLYYASGDREAAALCCTEVRPDV